MKLLKNPLAALVSACLAATVLFSPVPNAYTAGVVGAESLCAQESDPDWLCYIRMGSDCLWQYNQCMEDNEGASFCDDVFDGCMQVTDMMCGVE
ncbi:MAG: hypothetical protein OXJ54_09340 [Gemmatimonadetes bacterium]|nr:hypothetical protein [Candidatus Palauibacter rhopaloidicola]